MTIFVPWLATPAPPAYPGSEARYHRLVITHTHNSDGSFRPAELAMYDDWAGSALTIGVRIGTPSVGTIADVSDGDRNTDAVFTMPNAVIGFDHSSAELLVEFSLTASAGHFGDTLFSEAMPSEMELQESSDNTNWITVRTYTGIPPWFQNETRYFPVADETLAASTFDGKWRHQRTRAITTQVPDRFVLSEWGLYDNVGDPAASWASGAPLLPTHPRVSFGADSVLRDGGTLTICGVLMSEPYTNPAGGWFGLFFGHTPKTLIAEVLMTNYGFANINRSPPIEFVVEGSNWGGNYTEVARFGGTGVDALSWATGETKRFQL